MNGALLLVFLGGLQSADFSLLLRRLAEAWNRGDARAAAECFTEDAVYIEPPDRQLYRGREELYRFFGGEEGRPGTMSMSWHHVAFDEERQVGFGEFTFAYGSQVHGAVIVQLQGGKIHRWREYWYEAKAPYPTFVSESDFAPSPSSADFARLMQSLAEKWNRSEADAAAGLFAENAIYLEPPDRQRYRGREALRRFFAETARVAPMKMVWHHLAFDRARGVGAGEYTFAWNGRKHHGIAWAQIEGGLVEKWREYQYASELEYPSFVGESSFGAAEERESERRYPVKIEYDQKVRMRDGVNLSADVFRPDAPGRFPVILVRTPYDNASPGYARQGLYWASHGYVYVVQDVRGRGESEGEFYPLVHEAEDGYDTQTWCGESEWSNGKVGTTGGSYLGWTQLYPAGLRNPYLAAMISIVTPPDPLRNFPIQHGAYSPTTVSWLAYVSGKTLQDTSHIDLMAAYQALPLREIDERFGRRIPAWRDWFDHPLLDDYWRQQAYQESLLGATVPILHVSGWYDDVLVGTTENYVNLRTRAKDAAMRGKQWLLVGPWGHRVNTTQVLGGVDFGPEALIDLDGLSRRWFDRWLKGEDNGVDSDPRVRLFVMGENRWRNENEWPIARTRYVDYHLHSQGKANSRFGDGRLDTMKPSSEPPDSYRYDPEDPVPFITEPNFSQVGGPDDYRSVERRDDVLVYSSDPLGEPLEVCGPLSIRLYAASSARDTDWTAKVLDVHPDGLARRLNDGIVRARYRKSMERETFLEPGRVEAYDIDAWSTCVLMEKGHRLRLEISSSAFPKFDRNLNTGGPIGKETKGLVAEQTVYHDRDRPSWVRIPIVPRPAP